MRHILINGLAIFVFGGWSIGFARAQEQLDPEKDTLARATIQGYAANRESFAYVKCRLTETRAKARSFEDALAGKFIEPTVARKLLIIDGKKVLIQQEVDDQPSPEELKKKTRNRSNGAMGVTQWFSHSGYLGDGTRKLRYTPSLGSSGSANILTSEIPDLGECVTLLHLGNASESYAGGPDYDLRQCDAGKYLFWPEGYQTIDEKLMVKVSFGNSAKQRMADYYFDTDHGFLPYRITTYEVKKNRVYGHICLTHARQCSKGRWFPERSINVILPQQEGGLFSVRETKVVELDVDRRPNGSEFTLELPAGTAMFDPHQDVSFKLKQNEKINVDDLPKLVEMCRLMLVTPRMDTAIPRRNPYLWLTWLGGAAAAILMGWLAFYFVRRWRPRAVGSA